MKKFLIGALVLAAAGFGIWKYMDKIAALPAAPRNDKPVIKVGVILPLTGNLASMGQAAKGAVEVAAEKIKREDTKYSYEFIFEDNQWSPAKTAVILSKFISVDKIDALLDGGSAVGKVTSPKTEERQIIHLNVWASDKRAAEGKYNFVNHTQPEYEASRLTKVIKDKGYANVIIVSVNDEGCLVVSKALQKELDSAGVKNRMETINLGTRDFKIMIEKMQKENPDLYVEIMWEPELNIFLKQMGELGYKTDITTIEAIPFDNLYQFEGRWYVDAAEGKGPVMNEIRAHNKSDTVYGVSNMYDNVMLLVGAFEKAESKDKAVDELIKVKEYEGVTGRLAQDDEGVFQSQAVVKKVVNGKSVVME